jgi:hypothetical protein
LGAGDYGDSGACKRSTHAYPTLLAAQRKVASFQFAACAGARLDQFDDQLSKLAATTTLVTLSVGGTDVGFKEVMDTCMLKSDQECLSRIEQAKNFVTTSFSGLLDKVYSGIKSRAPQAQVIVVGYPRFYEDGAQCSGNVSEVKRKAINAGVDLVVTVVESRSKAAGFAFQDMRPVFAGHGVCSAKPWLNAITNPVEESFHPTKEAHALGYLPTLMTALAS